MHVGAKIGLAIAGGAAAGFALKAATPNHESSTSSNLAFLGVGVGGAAINARMLATSSTMPWLSMLGIAAGTMSAAMSIGNLFDAPAAKSGVRELAPGPIPSPRPGPSPHPLSDPNLTPEFSPSGPSAEPTPDETGAVDTGPVEEEVESYGPDGEYLGSEHGTLG